MTGTGPPAGRLSWPRGLLATLGAPVLIALAALAAYHGSLSGPFILDDGADIVDNPSIRHLWPPGAALSPPAGSGLTVSGRPVLNFSLALNYSLGGTDVRGYHALNLLLHILAGLTLFGIVRRTLDGRVARARLAALAAAVLWTVHPLQTEAVTYVIQRAESLMGLFYLLTLYCFIRGAAAPRPRPALGWHVLSAAACLLGMATKEVMGSAPLIVLLYDRTFLSGTFREAWRRHRGAHLALAATWLVLANLMLGTGARGHTVGFGSGTSWASYALTQFHAVAHYLRLSLWPHPLVFDYGPAAANPGGTVPEIMLVAFLLGATLAALARPGRARGIGFAGAWFFAILAPTSSVVPVATQAIAEHRMYLPLAAVAVAAVLALRALPGRAGLLACLGLAVVLGGLAERRNRDYRSGLSIWSDTVRKNPGNARAQYNLAVELARIPGRTPEALADYDRALRIDPDYAEAHFNLGVELARIPGRTREALDHYEKALALDPDNAEAHYNLAIELARIPGRGPDAIAHCREALRLRPEWAEAHECLADELAKVPGRGPEAIAQYEAALRLKPDDAEAHSNLAVELAKVPGRGPEAIAQYEAALRLKPGYATAHFNLANELAGIPGREPEAIAHYEAALRLDPGFAEAHVNLAVARARSGQLDQAIAHLEAALRLNPGLPGIREALESLKAAAGR